MIRPAAAEVPCGERITESQECCGKEFSEHTWQEPDLEKSDRILARQEPVPVLVIIPAAAVDAEA